MPSSKNRILFRLCLHPEDSEIIQKILQFNQKTRDISLPTLGCFSCHFTFTDQPEVNEPIIEGILHIDANTKLNLENKSIIGKHFLHELFIKEAKLRYLSIREP